MVLLARASFSRCARFSSGSAAGLRSSSSSTIDSRRETIFARFLALAAALLSYRTPPLIALNEPEASLHPDMLAPLAGMIARAAEGSQLWIVTHSERLAQEVETRCGVRAKRVVRNDGATWIDGMRLTGAMDDDDE